MSTPNIDLEMLVLDDTLNKSMINKLNTNMQKLDNKYGELKESLLEQTRKETLKEAIAYIQTLADRIAELEATGTASASTILALFATHSAMTFSIFGAMPFLSSKKNSLSLMMPYFITSAHPSAKISGESVLSVE